MSDNDLYLVTGAAGHLGRVVTQKLLDGGKQVRILILPWETDVPPAQEIFRGDVTDREGLRPFFAAPGKRVTVIHCAGIVSIASGYNQKLYDVNVGGTKNVAELCMEYGVRKLVYVSSVHAIPELPEGETISETSVFSPNAVTGHYAKSKALATAFVLEAASRGLDASVVHPSGIIGPYDRGSNHTTALIRSFFRGTLPAGVMGGYDFVDVRDVAAGVIACAERGRKGECYILSNRYFTVREVLDRLHRLTHRRSVPLYLPLGVAAAMAPAAEWFARVSGKVPLYTPYSIYTLGTNAHFSNQKARKELGYSVRNMNRTLADTVEWLKTQPGMARKSARGKLRRAAARGTA